MLDAIERVEVALRTKLVYIFVHQYGPFGYLNANNFPHLRNDEFVEFHKKLKNEIRRSKENFITHFNFQHGDSHDMPPLWMACELFSFGLFLTFYRGVDKKIKQNIARQLGVPDVVLFSWLICLNTVRNLCAHHGRTFDKQLRYYLPNHKRKYPDWFVPVRIKAGRIFGVLTLLRYCLRIVAPNSQWHKRLCELFKEYHDIPLNELGFPLDWNKSSFWNDF